MNQSAEMAVVEANVRFYREWARKYDSYETCVTSGALQLQLIQDIARIEALVGSRTKAPVCFDCGGGSGNLALKLLKRGWSVTVVDVSADMLAILETRARGLNLNPRLINGDIEEFFKTASERFDLVAFSSVLHHLYNYIEVVNIAAAHVVEGGIFYSNFDPVVTTRPYLQGAFGGIDTLLAKLAYDRSDLIPGILRRIRKAVWIRDTQLGRTVVSSGDLAEYHAKTGLDETAILQSLRAQGLVIREHSRWNWARTDLVRFLNSRLRFMESFKILAQREALE